MQIQLRWTNPDTELSQQPILETPVALGREFTSMPAQQEGQRVSRIVLADDRVNPFHALLIEHNGELLIVDQNSLTGTRMNGVALPSSTLVDGDRLQIGPFQIQVSLLGGLISPGTASAQQSDAGCDRMVGFLFKRRCGRTQTTGCPHCDAPNQEPYFYDRSYYSGYGIYEHGYWGSDYYHNRHHYSYDSDQRNVDFTEADSALLEHEGDRDYEQDLGAS